MKRNSTAWVKPLLVILVIVQFFRLDFIYDYLNFIYSGYRVIWLFVILFILSYNKKRDPIFNRLMFPKLLIGYFILILINCISCLYFRQQPLSISMLAWAPFFPLIFYPCFKSWNLHVATWEKTLFYLFLIILLGYTLQNIFSQYQLFQLDITWDKFIRTGRVRIKSDGILYLGLLFCWNKYLCYNKNKYLILALLAFLMVFLQGYRILIVTVIIVCVLLYHKINGLKRKTLILLIIVPMVADVALRFDFINEKFEEMIERNEDQTFENEDYVRVLDLEYFYNDHFLNNAEFILGSGMPVLAVDLENKEVKKTKLSSIYSQYMSQLGAYFHMFTVDLGIVGLSWIAGIPFTLLLVFLLISIYRKDIGKEYLYLGGYCLLSLLCGFTNGLLYKGYDMVYIALILVILDLILIKQKQQP